MLNIHYKLLHQSLGWFIGIFVFIQLSTSFLFAFIADLIGQNSAFKGLDLSKYTPFEQIFLIIVLAPLLETLIFQLVIIRSVQVALLKVKSKSLVNILAVIVSAVLFGLSHNFGYLYIANTFLGGILFGYAFVLSQYKRWPAFWVVTLIHSLYNTIVFFVKTI